MNTAVIASIISVVGAGFIGVLIVFLQAIRADISGLREDTTSGLESLRKDMTSGFESARKEMSGAKESLARIESTQEAHGRQLALMADHGARIAAIEATLSAAS
ncbi:MAG: hypothetical protein OXG52_04575 [bacterium]|nr:hypothetical protein [bacterium]